MNRPYLVSLISTAPANAPGIDRVRVKVKLPERQKPGSYREPDYPYKYIPEKY
jgi:hypothetical protein